MSIQDLIEDTAVGTSLTHVMVGNYIQSEIALQTDTIEELNINSGITFKNQIGLKDDLIFYSISGGSISLTVDTLDQGVSYVLQLPNTLPVNNNILKVNEFNDLVWSNLVGVSGININNLNNSINIGLTGNIGNITVDNLNVNAGISVSGDSFLCGNVTICNDLGITGNLSITGNTHLCGDVDICDDLTINGTANFNEINANGGVTGIVFVAKITDEKTIGTNGGTFTSGAWQTRTLNTLVDNNNILLGITNNTFILAPGLYQVQIQCPAVDVKAHQCRLYNVSDNIVESIGTNAYNASSQGYTFLFTFIECSGNSKVYRVEHRCEKTRTNYGLGQSNGWGTEIYTQVLITKVTGST